MQQTITEAQKPKNCIPIVSGPGPGAGAPDRDPKSPPKSLTPEFFFPSTFRGAWNRRR